MEVKTYWKHYHLPHIQPIGRIFFITFRLFDSLPKSYVDKLRAERDKKLKALETAKPIGFKMLMRNEEKRFFKKMDEALDKINNSPQHLNNPEIAKILREKLHQFDDNLYTLLSYCIMPNHVHLLIDTGIQVHGKDPDIDINTKNYTQIDKIIKRIKGSTARLSNQILKRKSHFWHRDYYDYFVRNEEEILRIISYIINNPVKANLVENWKDWPYSYWKKLDS